jgi:hypothetical protein
MNKFSVGTIIGTALLPLLKRRGASNVFKKEKCLRLSFQDRYIWLEKDELSFSVAAGLENQLKHKMISGPIEEIRDTNTKNHFDDKIIKLQKNIKTILSRIRLPWFTEEETEKELTPIRLKINEYKDLSEYYNKGKIEAHKSIYSWDVQIGEFAQHEGDESSATRISFYVGVLLKPNLFLDWNENKETRLKLDQIACYLSSIVNNKILSILNKYIFPFSNMKLLEERVSGITLLQEHFNSLYGTVNGFPLIEADDLESEDRFIDWLEPDDLKEAKDQFIDDFARYIAWGWYGLYIEEKDKFFQYTNDGEPITSSLLPPDIKLRER